eukprot:scaffold256162_cov48-Prasinocladus_malaysianus.AAC.1
MAGWTSPCITLKALSISQRRFKEKHRPGTFNDDLIIAARTDIGISCSSSQEARSILSQLILPWGHAVTAGFCNTR